MRNLTTLRFVAALGIAALSPVVQAEGIKDLPTGDVVLTISGEIAHSNLDGEAHFDLEMLENLGATEIVTSTIWTEGTQQFVGVSLMALLDYVGATGNNIEATAINDYSVNIPVEDAVEGGALVAYFRNGEPMSVREKGPLWVVYPFDLEPKFKTETYHARSIWQLDRIKVKP